jgi:hypothetical protein
MPLLHRSSAVAHGGRYNSTGVQQHPALDDCATDWPGVMTDDLPEAPAGVEVETIELRLLTRTYLCNGVLHNLLASQI